jgi:ABC-type dipeptide/oligopeptide/nickel transport systems, permease components
MFEYLIRRFLWAAGMFVAVTVFAFVTFHVVPGNPALRGLPAGASQVDVRNRERLLGVDRPLPEQYGAFLWRLVVHQSLGNSWINRRSVNQIVGDAAPVTASLVVGGAVLWMLIAIPVGIISALRPRSLLDRIAMAFTLIGISAHPVWIGLMLSWGLGFRLGWFPITGYCDMIHPSIGQFCGGPTQWAYHLVLPWFTFAALYAALYTRMVRASVMDALDAEWVTTARAKGGSFAHVLRVHVLRNAMLPIVTMFGMDIAVALGGSLFVETVWSLPGLGNTAVQSLTNHDLPTTEGIIVFVALCVIVLNFFVDTAYSVLDPRVRLKD